MINEYFSLLMVIYKFYLPDVTEGDEVHDLIASFMKLIAQSNDTIAMIARKIGMILNILNVETIFARSDYYRMSSLIGISRRL